MRPEERELFKTPFEISLRERIIKLINPPINVKKGDIVKGANINHQTFLDFMNGKKDTKTKALSRLNDVVNSFEERLGENIYN